MVIESDIKWGWYGQSPVKYPPPKIKHERNVQQRKDYKGGHLLLIDLHLLSVAPWSGMDGFCVAPMQPLHPILVNGRVFPVWASIDTQNLVPLAWQAGESLFLLSEVNQPSNCSQLGPEVMNLSWNNFKSCLFQRNIRDLRGGEYARDSELCWNTSLFCNNFQVSGQHYGTH